MEIFKYFDKNGDGKIFVIEFGQVLRSVGIVFFYEEFEVMVNEVDCDNDGFIDLVEFIQFNKFMQEVIDDEDSEYKMMVVVFEVFDINKDGFILVVELYRVFFDLGEVFMEEDC